MASVADLPVFDAVILAGGEAKRLGGRDKAELVFRGERLLDRVVRAVDDANQVVAVGPRRPTAQTILWTREVPSGGGPVAAVEAALTLIDAPFVVVVAVDLPLLERVLVRKLVAEADHASAVLALDADGNVQPLLACYPSAPLRAALAQQATTGGSMMSLLSRLAHRTVPDEGRSRDCDTLSDIEELQIERGGGERAGGLA